MTVLEPTKGFVFTGKEVMSFYRAELQVSDAQLQRCLYGEIVRIPSCNNTIDLCMKKLFQPKKSFSLERFWQFRVTHAHKHIVALKHASFFIEQWCHVYPQLFLYFSLLTNTHTHKNLLTQFQDWFL